MDNTEDLDLFLNKLIASDTDLLLDNFFTLTSDQRYLILSGLLKKYHCEITFRKIDGSLRVMPCTLKYEFLPVMPESKQKVKSNLLEDKKETLRVFCTDKNEWRSFKVMNVISVKCVKNN